MSRKVVDPIISDELKIIQILLNRLLLDFIEFCPACGHAVYREGVRNGRYHHLLKADSIKCRCCCDRCI